MANAGDLSTGVTGSVSQSTTQDPQNSTQTSSLGQSENVQTGTPTSALTGHGSIQLQYPNVAPISLSASTVKTAPPTPVSTHHAVNPALLGFSILLFVVAIVLFWTTSRPESVKSTTEKA